MFGLMKQSLLTSIGCWFAFYVCSPISFFTVIANFFFLFYSKVDFTSAARLQMVIKELDESPVFNVIDKGLE